MLISILLGLIEDCLSTKKLRFCCKSFVEIFSLPHQTMIPFVFFSSRCFRFVFFPPSNFFLLPILHICRWKFNWYRFLLRWQYLRIQLGFFWVSIRLHIVERSFHTPRPNPRFNLLHFRFISKQCFLIFTRKLISSISRKLYGIILKTKTF